MSGGIEVDPKPAILRRLVIVPACTQSEYRWFGRVDVTYREVEMELLRMVAARPGRSHPVVDSLERKRGATVGVVRRNAAPRGNQGRPVAVRALLHGPTQQVGIELAELQGIRAVQDDQVENGLVSCRVGHSINVNGDPDEWRPDFHAHGVVRASYRRVAGKANGDDRRPLASPQVLQQHATGGSMPDSTSAQPHERVLRLRYAGDCRDCGTPLAAGTRARWNPDSRTVRCLACPTPRSPSEESPPSRVAAALDDDTPNWGTAGASAQRRFEEQENRRRMHLRTRWVAVVVLSLFGVLGGAILAAVLDVQAAAFVVLGAVLPVLKLLATPQHVDAWRSGAAGERAVGARLDRLRSSGVLTLHD